MRLVCIFVTAFIIVFLQYQQCKSSINLPLKPLWLYRDWAAVTRRSKFCSCFCVCVLLCWTLSINYYLYIILIIILIIPIRQGSRTKKGSKSFLENDLKIYEPLKWRQADRIKTHVTITCQKSERLAGTAAGRRPGVCLVFPYTLK